MLNAIIAFSLRHRALVLVCTLVLALGGAYAFSRLPIDAVPDITNNQIQILTQAPALSALEVERFVTFPVELAVKSLPDLVELRSLSRPGLSVITVVFDDDVDVYFGRQLILEKLREVEDEMPEGVETPELGPVSTGLGEIFRYVVRDTSGRYSPMELRTIQDWIVRRSLLGAEALAEINSLGGQLQQYQVLVDPEKLSGYGLTLRDVFHAISETSDNAGGAYIETGPEQLAVRSVGLATSLDDIRQAVVRATPDGTPVTVGDMADVELGPAVRFGSASADGKGEVVVGIVMQLKGANARTTVQGVKERIEEIRPALPEGVVIEPYYDREELVDRTIGTVVTNLIEGALFVIGVLLVLLMSVRAGLILASVIPLAMCFAGIMMLLFDVSGNLMSLGAIDFGLVVDGSLIIVENVLRRLEERFRGTGNKPLTDAQMRELVFDGAVEVRKAAQFGEIIIIMVYLPILTLQGIEGKLFQPMALTVGFALIGALLLSITYVPAITSLVLRGQKRVRHSPIIEALRRWYIPALEWALRRRSVVMITAGALVAVALFGFSRLGGEFIPRLDEGDIAMHLIRLPSVSLSESQKMATRVERELMTFPEVRTVVSHTGRAEVSTDPMGFELADIFIMLHPEDEWTTGRSKPELIAEMKERLEGIPGGGTQFLQPIEMRTNELIAGARGDVVVKIIGENYEIMEPAAATIAAIMRETPGGTDVAAEQTSGLPQLVIRPDRSVIARYGLTVADVNHVVETAIGGSTAGTIYEGERSFDLVLRFPDETRRDLSAIRSMMVATPGGAQVPLFELASIEIEQGPTQISREAGSRFTSVQANVRGRDVKSFVTEVRERINEEIDLPPGYAISYGGQFENLEEASDRLIVVVPIALFLIFALLYQTFGSLRLGLLIFLCIPMSIVGGVAALVLRGMPFSISAGVGFIALFGVAVLNGIVMVAAFRRRQVEGSSRREAVLAGAEERLRPVIATAALAGFGFLPMMLATSAGAEVQRPLATVIIGGLISATLLTLFVLPAVYDRFGGEPTPEEKEEDNDVQEDTEEFRRTEERRAGAGGTAAALFFLVALGIGTASAVSPAQTVLTRETLIERATSATLLLARDQATLERIRYEGASVNLLPPTELSYEIEEYPTGSLPGGATQSIGIGQMFRWPTVYSARAEAAQARIRAAEARIDVTRRDVTVAATRIWIDLVAARLRLNLADTAAALAQEIAAIARFRRAVGDIDSLQAIRAEIPLTEARRDSIAAWGATFAHLAEARALLAAPAEEFAIQPPSLSATSGDDRAILLERLRERHPQLRAIQAAVDAARAERRVVEAGSLPSFGIEGRYQIVDGRSPYLGGGLRLELPIARWFNDAPERAADAEILEREAERAAIERELIARLDALIARRDATRTLLEYDEAVAVPAAREAWRIALRLYEEGETTLREALDARTTLLEAQRRHLETLLDLERIAADIELLAL